MKKDKKSQEQEEKARVANRLAEAQGYRATFLEVVQRSLASGGVDQGFVERVLDAFSALELEINSTTDEDVLETLCDRAEELERLRAYVLPDHEILLQARTCLADMRDWGVPRATLRSIEADLLPVMRRKDDVQMKRAALHKLFDFYDWWESQVTSYDDWIGARSTWLSIVLALGLGAAITGLVLGIGLLSFLAGGLAGSLASVLSRLPSMLGWGLWAGLPARMYSRIGLGIAGTIAGGGLMATGIFTVGKEAAQFSQIISTSYQASTSDGLYLVAVGILLGFSERLLSGLAGALVKVPTAPAAPKRDSAKEEDKEEEEEKV